MRHSIVAALMAATALIPGAAFAQREGRDGFTDRGAARQAAQQARSEQAAQAEPAPVQAAAQASPPRLDRAGVGQFRSDRGGESRADAAAQIEARGERGDRFHGDRPGVGRPEHADDGGRFDRGAGRPDRSAPAATPVLRNPARADRGGGAGNDLNRRSRGWQDNADRGQNRGNWNGNVDRGDARNGTWRNDGNRGGWNDGNRSDWRGGNDRGNWNRNWRQDNRYDWNRRRQYNRNAYHLPRYYAPSGWNYGYRRFDVGFTLSALLFRQNYWIDDPYHYGLPEAYGQYRWVRYYNDALLVDVYSGQVVDTVYDIFW